MAGWDGEFGKAFGERFRNENLIRWQAIMLCCHFAMIRWDTTITEEYGHLPSDGPYSLVNGGGGKGIVWGKVF